MCLQSIPIQYRMYNVFDTNMIEIDNIVLWQDICRSEEKGFLILKRNSFKKI